MINRHRHGDHDVGWRKRVHGMLVEKGDADVDELAGEQKHQRQHDPHAQPEGIARPQVRRQRFERAQLVLEAALLARRADCGDRAPARAHRVGSAGSGSASSAAPRARMSLSATSKAAATNTAPQKKAALRPNSPKKNPAAAGPSTRERLPTDCDTPKTSPCSSRPARREIRLLSDGCVRPMPSRQRADRGSEHCKAARKRQSKEPGADQCEAAEQQALLAESRVSAPISPPCRIAERIPT